jgi:hypothetical protein
MDVLGLEFHRSFWDIVMLLEGIRHPHLKLAVSTIDFIESNTFRHQGFNIATRNNAHATLMINSYGMTETEEQRAQLGFKEFSASDNVYLTPRYKTLTPPVDIAIPARRAHLSADIIYYWFMLNVGPAEEAIALRNAISRKYAMELQKQMKTWLDTIDQFHKYTQLQD